MKKGNNRRFLTATVGLLMLISLVLVACGGSQTTSSPTPTATPTPTPTPTPTSVVITLPILGTYTVTITQAEAGSTAVPGHWTITFMRDGTYAVLLEGATDSEGSYSVKQNQLTLMKDVICSYAGTGTYTWALQGNKLTLKAVVDTCGPRKLVFTTHPWVKQG
jgi:hypothetical protein